MDQDLFFSKIKLQFQKQLPFVAYRKPNQSQVDLLLQQTNDLHEVESYQESGFVFAPFKLEEKTILFPFTDCESLSLQRYNKESQETFQGTSNSSKSDMLEHIALVERAVETMVQEGEFKKVVLSRKEIVKTDDINPVTVFKNILGFYNGAFCYIWYHPQVGLWLGATPETLLQVSRNKFSTMSLAGTQRFKDTLEVEWGEKELEEQQIVTDTIVEAINNVIPKIEVSKTKTHQAGSLLHLKTDISGILKPSSLQLKELVEALHPTPAVCGLPKDRAKKFILENEHYQRTYYTGFLGELNKEEVQERNRNRRNVENSAYKSSSKSTHFFVNLRSMECLNNEVHLFVGGGITTSSNPLAEWQETVFKTETMKQVL